jgi:hypothetical protein
VEGSLASILMRVPEAEVRLVGTASSVLRGIDLPANDIDIVFNRRAGVDSWFGVLSADLDVDRAPAWIADSQQYFARMHDGDVTIELSTVEIETDADTMECFGEGPWRYFDFVPCGSRTVWVPEARLGSGACVLCCSFRACGGGSGRVEADVAMVGWPWMDRFRLLGGTR